MTTLRAACAEHRCPRRAQCLRYRTLRVDDPWQPRVAGAERGVGCRDHVPLDGRVVLQHSAQEIDQRLRAREG